MTKTWLKTDGKWFCQRRCMLSDPWSALQPTNETPRERLFRLSRRAMTDTSLPSWLLTTGPVLQRCFVQRKDDPLTTEVQLLEANPSYTAVRFSDWRESSISTSDLAPLPESPVGLVDTCGDFDDVRCNQPELSPDTMDSHSVADGSFDAAPADNPAPYPRNVPLHRSTGIHRPPDRYGDCIVQLSHLFGFLRWWMWCISELRPSRPCLKLACRADFIKSCLTGCLIYFFSATCSVPVLSQFEVVYTNCVELYCWISELTLMPFENRSLSYVFRLSLSFLVKWSLANLRVTVRIDRPQHAIFIL